MPRLQKHQLKALTAGLELPPPIPRKKMSQEESIMQRALIRWWSANCRHFGIPEWLLFSIPNGGARSPVTGKILKLEGARRGVPDLFLAVSCIAGNETHLARYFGLFLELKRPAGIVAPEQEAYHKLLTEQGYKVVVVRSLNAAIDAITTYLTK